MQEQREFVYTLCLNESHHIPEDMAMYYLYSNLPSYTSTEVSVSDFYGLAPGGLANGKPNPTDSKRSPRSVLL